jgi:hypothetical protein
MFVVKQVQQQEVISIPFSMQHAAFYQMLVIAEHSHHAIGRMMSMQSLSFLQAHAFSVKVNCWHTQSIYWVNVVLL